MIAHKPGSVSLVFGGIVAMAAPAFAQEATTLQYVIAKGAVVKLEYQGQPVEISRTYKPDGAYSGSSAGQTSSGKWRIDGDKLCQTPDATARETCMAYPAGKKPGDTFKTTTPVLGEAAITINQ